MIVGEGERSAAILIFTDRTPEHMFTDAPATAASAPFQRIPSEGPARPPVPPSLPQYPSINKRKTEGAPRQQHRSRAASAEFARLVAEAHAPLCCIIVYTANHRAQLGTAECVHDPCRLGTLTGVALERELRHLHRKWLLATY